MVGVDLLEATFGGAGAAYPVLFAAYLVGLGVVGAGVAAAVRKRDGGSARRLGAAGAFALVGAGSLLFALAVLVGTDQLEPVGITAAAGLLMLALAAWLAG
ncbi:hypothetical protein BRC81_13370 [Halobacteriales archaeon QS_1_68_20]|nr:MAG: hypothetical protein BRC81_13370 [Halobacteriales archaeon QS_1_68_20]